MKLRSGDIGFVHERGSFIGEAIAWFMRSQYSHTFLILDVQETRTYTLETSEFQVGIHTLEKYLANPKKFKVVVFRLRGETTEESIEGTNIAFALRQGETYGYLQLISFAVRNLWKRIRPTWITWDIPNFFRQGVVCTGVALEAKSHGTIAPFAGMDPESIDTEEFYQLVKQHADIVLESGQ